MAEGNRALGRVRFASDGRLVQANEVAAARFGFASPAELIAAAQHRSLIQPLPPGEGSWVDRFADIDEPVFVEAHCSRRDGSSWTCGATVLPPPRREGAEPLEIDLLLLDELTEDAPPPSAGGGPDILDSVLDGLPNPVFVKDERHRWVILNESFCRFIGHPRAELLGKSDYDYFAPKEADVFWAKDDIVFRGGGTVENEETLTDARGRKHVILTRKTLRRDASGRPLLLGVITDISERKEVEEKLRDSEERTRRQQEVLEEGDRRKNEFLALLGHELRNPLHPMRLAIAVMRSACAHDPKVARAHAIVDRQVTQMTRLIDDLLDVSRISSGKMLLRYERFDLVELVRTVLGDRTEHLEGHGLRLESRFPVSPLVVNGDPARIAQAMGNLLDNAEKFTDSGGRITVTLERDVESRGARLTVEDTGIGMSRETLGQVFEPFVQSEAGMRRGRGGLGLGLSLVRSLAELHGGTVKATSDGVGRGSRLTIWLPMPYDTADEPADGASKARVAATNAHRVLVIEDNADAAAAVELALSAAGHEVTLAGSGEEGISRAVAIRPRVVLSDIRLPGMTGYDVARALRQEKALDATYLVAVTGFGQDEDRVLARDAGFDGHLTKPVDAEALERLLAGLPPHRGA
jgi:two-component system CheB/CheR fusion protein